MTKKKVEGRLQREPQPTPEQLQMIDDLEESDDLGGLGGDLDAAHELMRGLLPGKIHGYAIGAPPPEATQARPGSEEKILILRQRARRGLALHHAGDLRLDRPPK